MTQKGIIQKVFEKEIEYWQKAIVSDDYSSNIKIYSFQIANLQRLEQKLIKGIRKESKYMSYPHSIKGNEYLAVTTWKLLGDYPMGDNKE